MHIYIYIYIHTHTKIFLKKIWGVLKGRDVILRGSRWRIGNGKLMKVWQSHWLSRKHHPIVFSPTLSSMEDATVDILIDTPTRQRNHGLIDGNFSPQEANLIKKIPLAQVESNDSIFWPLARMVATLVSQAIVS